MHKHCTVCEAIYRNDLQPSPLSNVALANQIGTSETSIRRHRRASTSNVTLNDVDEFFEDVPTSIITSRGKSYRTPDGSWEKITYKPAAKAFHDAIAFEDIDAVFNGWDFDAWMDTRIDGDGNETLVVNAADFQAGKTGSGGDTQALVNRAMWCYSQIAQYAKKRQFAQIVFADNGDVIENFTNVVAQSQTNDLSLTDQVRIAYKLLLHGVKFLAPLAPSFVYVAVPSNHASVRTNIGDSNRANFPGDDYGLLIQDLIQLYAEDRSDMAHIEFVRPNRYDETVTFTAQDGTTLAFTHGHLAGKQANLPQWYANQIAGRTVPGIADSHILVTGHFHSAYVAEAADGRLVIGAPTLDNGSDYYRNQAGKSNTPGMLTFKTDKGEMNGWRIWRPNSVA